MTTYDILLTFQAESDIRNIDDYISNELLLPDSAVKIVGSIRKKISSLAIFPERGRLYRVGIWEMRGVRIVQIKNYKIIFYPDKEHKRVIILHILYSRQDIDKILMPE